jgi:protocatechuate 3,4-dioxygenase, beta subunit
MKSEVVSLNRRRFTKTLALGASLYAVPGLFAEQLLETCPLTEGPFYPDQLPLDTDNDLLVINNAITPAVGTVTYLSGRVTTKTGQPVRNAFIEIWQVDAKASYLHTKGAGANGRDGNFQGYGRFVTGSDGRYWFRTIQPVPYKFGDILRAPHIHVAVSGNGHRIFTSQVHIQGDPNNAQDLVLKPVKDPAARATIIKPFVPMPGGKLGELAVNFDVVLGGTVQEFEDGRLGIGKPQWKGTL